MQTQLKNLPGRAGFTIAEMVICFAVMALVIGGMLTAYTNTSKYAERAGYALAAQSLAVQELERVRAAKWDTQDSPIVDQTTSIPTNNIFILDLPISGTNAIYATDVVSVSTIQVSANPPVSIKMISVTTTWPWQNKVMTNTLVTYRAPDQ